MFSHSRAGLRTRYWDWTEREGEEHHQKYGGTLFTEGMENAFRRHQLLAEAVRRAIEVRVEGGAIEFNIIASKSVVAKT